MQKYNKFLFYGVFLFLGYIKLFYLFSPYIHLELYPFLS